jgi:hypothetical protein
VTAPAVRWAAAALLCLAALPLGAQLPSVAVPDRSAVSLDRPPHPLLAPLVPQLRFGFFRRRSETLQRDTPLAPSADPRDLAGRYSPQEATLLLPGERGRMASYTDSGARTFLARAQEQLAGRQRADPPRQCKPEGAVRALNQGYTVQVLQSPTQLTTIHMGNHLVRRVRIGGGTTAAAAARASFVGTSVGRWEGNTLVVETRGIRDGSWLDEYGDPGSERTMLSERYTKQPNGSLRIEATINDPVNYSEPIRFVRNWKWTPDVAWDERICEEGNHDAMRQP